ncbi:MAG TPA: bifunctional DNA primase/polymerase, partial [Candidatus Dormibacteraeota bacterium]|nr:bifunctional DNA primase/polymerase [Candidatus Dormibacteraeota bacterium]
HRDERHRRALRRLRAGAKELSMNPARPVAASALRRAALLYAVRGWRVLPLWWPADDGCACGLPGCDDAGKHPIGALVPRGLHDATRQLAALREWWSSFPNANVGIRTGAESGLVVLDVDGSSGRLTLRALVAAHTPIDARWARTGGGWHAYFAHPGVAVPSSAGRVGPGLDVRGDGGYVIAPPSLHGSRRLYRWIGHDASPFPLDSLPAMPPWLLALALPDDAPTQHVHLRTGKAAAYAAAAAERETIEVAGAPPGQRNHRLNRAAFKLGQLVGAGLLEEAAAAAALVGAGLQAGPGERKIRATVERGLGAGRRHPRQIALLHE